MDFFSMILETILDFFIGRIPFSGHPILRAVLQIILMMVICALIIAVVFGVAKLIGLLRK